MENAEIRIDGILCGKFPASITNLISNEKFTFTCASPIVGSKVRITLGKTNEGLALAGVEVYYETQTNEKNVFDRFISTNPACPISQIQAFEDSTLTTPFNQVNFGNVLIFENNIATAK